LENNEQQDNLLSSLDIGTFSDTNLGIIWSLYKISDTSIVVLVNKLEYIISLLENMTKGAYSAEKQAANENNKNNQVENAIEAITAIIKKMNQVRSCNVTV
jgi:hypothetical protein